MADDRPFMRRHGWRVYLMGALIAALVVAIGGPWWGERPKRAAERFISLLSQGQIDQASAILHAQSSLQTDAGGNVVIKARDGTAARLTRSELSLVAFGPATFPPRGIGGYLTGKHHFMVSTSGSAVLGPKNGQTKRLVDAVCVAEGGRIDIGTIWEQLSRWGYVDFESQSDQAPGIDLGTVFYAFLDDERGFVIWTDFPLPSAGPLGHSGNVWDGSFSPRDGRSLEFKFKSHYAKPGTVTIGDREYDCADGRLFLVHGGREVKQIQRDLKELAGMLEEEAPATNPSGHRWYREDALADLARRDPEISPFYTAHTQKSGTTKAP